MRSRPAKGSPGCLAVAPRHQLLAVGPETREDHPALGEGAGLVRADHVGGAERLHGGQALEERPPARHAPHPHREREGDGGQKAFGDVGDEQPYGEEQGVGERQARDRGAHPKEHQAGADGHERYEPGGPVHLLLQGADLDPDALGQGGDPPELGAHPGRVDDGLGLAAGHERAPEDEVVGLQGRGGRPGAQRAARHGLRLARKRGHVHLDGTVDQARVRREPVALGEQDEVPGHEGRRLHLHRAPLATDAGAGRQVTLEGLGGLLGLELLEEGENGVQDYDRDDGDRERDSPSDDGQRRGRPEEEREGVCELAGELPKAIRALPAPDLVRAVLLEAAGGLPLGEAIPPGPEVAEEQIQALLGIYGRALGVLRSSPMPSRLPVPRFPPAPPTGGGTAAARATPVWVCRHGHPRSLAVASVEGS